MKYLTFVSTILLFSTVVFAQQVPPRLDPGYSVRTSEEIRSAVLSDLDGDGHPELCVDTRVSDLDEYYLTFIDLRMRREIERIRIPNTPNRIFSADLEGDGREEIILIPKQVWKATESITIFRWSLNQIVQEKDDSFYGVYAEIGDVNNDGGDELVLFHLPKGYTSLNGTGPFQVQVLEWNGSRFDLIANADYEESEFFAPCVSDLNGDGRAEIITGLSGVRGTPLGSVHHQELFIYTYTDQSELTLVDKFTVDTDEPEYIGPIWGYPLDDRKKHLVIPIERAYNNGNRVVDYLRFTLEDGQIIQGEEPLLFNGAVRNIFDTLSQGLYPGFKISDLNKNGLPEVIQIKDRRQVQFMEFTTPVIPRH